MTGRISAFNRQRGIGFISPGGTLPEVWFHVTNCDESWAGLKPAIGDEVSFDDIATSEGLKATRVSLRTPMARKKAA